MEQIAEKTGERWRRTLNDMIQGGEQGEPRESPKEHCHLQQRHEYRSSPGVALSRNTQTPADLPAVTVVVCLPDQRVRIAGNTPYIKWCTSGRQAASPKGNAAVLDVFEIRVVVRGNRRILRRRRMGVPTCAARLKCAHKV